MEIFHQKVMKFLLKKSSEISIFSCSEVPLFFDDALYTKIREEQKDEMTTKFAATP